MRYAVLVAGFDGTLARDGRCEPRSVAVLRALAGSGRKLILATSRQLRELLDVFPEATLFDYLVAENGAVVHRPAARESAILAPAPSEMLVHALKRHGVSPLSVGSTVVTTTASNRELIAQLIERLRLDCYLLDDGRSLTVLPVGVSKATGVQHALDDLGLSARNLVAVGDAENDVALFELAEHGVAVADSAASLKNVADRITRAAHADGLEEVARELLETDLAAAPTRRRIFIGKRAGQQEVALPPAQVSVLMTGPAASGKAALCNSLLSQYLTQQYQCCVIGAYPLRGAGELFAGLTVCGDEQMPPSHADVLARLAEPTQSVVVNLAALRTSSQAAYVEQLLDQFAELQARLGRPHTIVFDDPAGSMISTSAEHCARLQAASRIYLTAQLDNLPRTVLDGMDVFVALGNVAGTFANLKPRGPNAALADLPAIERGQACVWIRESGAAPFRIDLDTKAPAFRVIPEPASTTAPSRTRPAAVDSGAAAIQ